MARCWVGKFSTLVGDVAQQMDAWDKRSSALDLLLGMVEAQNLIRHSAPAHGNTIPVIIVAGFLGSGKTTLLRHVLTAARGQRIAAIVNDFAALNIDAALVADVTGDTVALENGCICCSLSGNVARTLLAITEREQRPDAIIVEASGVADPANIAQIASALPNMRLGSIAVVVDASADAAISEVKALQARQIAQADLILLNKTDLISDREAHALEDTLRRQAPGATLLRTVRCAVPTAFLLDGPHIEQAGADQENAAQPEFESAVFAVNGPLDRAALERCLSNLPDSPMRIKGFVELSCCERRTFLVQSVGRRWTIEEFRGHVAQCQLIAIGIKGGAIAATLTAHLADYNLSAQCWTFSG